MYLCMYVCMYAIRYLCRYVGMYVGISGIPLHTLTQFDNHYNSRTTRSQFRCCVSVRLEKLLVLIITRSMTIPDGRGFIINVHV